jgi:hypothetical protein
MEASVHRPRDASYGEEQRPLASKRLNEAILIIESFVRDAAWPLRLQNAWKHVKNTAFNAVQTSTATASSDDNNNDIRTIKAQLEGLTTIVRGLAEKPTTITKLSYADTLRKGTPASKVPIDRVAPVLARRPGDCCCTGKRGLYPEEALREGDRTRHQY